MRRWLTTALITALLGCASRQRADEMSAAAHLRAADRERALAAVDAASATDSRAPRSISTVGGGGGAWPMIADRRLTGRYEAFGHLERAAEHAAAAAALEGFAAKECAAIPAGSRAACPLVPVIAIEDLPNGVRLRLHREDVDDVLARMRCRLAFARAQGLLRSASCPLYIGGIDIVRATDGDGIDVIGRTRTVIAEIQRRAHGR